MLSALLPPHREEEEREATKSGKDYGIGLRGGSGFCGLGLGIRGEFPPQGCFSESANRQPQGKGAKGQ